MQVAAEAPNLARPAGARVVFASERDPAGRKRCAHNCEQHEPITPARDRQARVREALWKRRSGSEKAEWETRPVLRAGKGKGKSAKSAKQQQQQQQQA